VTIEIETDSIVLWLRQPAHSVVAGERAGSRGPRRRSISVPTASSLRARSLHHPRKADPWKATSAWTS